MSYNKKKLLILAAFTAILIISVSAILIQQLPEDVLAEDEVEISDGENCYACHNDPDTIDQMAVEEEEEEESEGG